MVGRGRIQIDQRCFHASCWHGLQFKTTSLQPYILKNSLSQGHLNDFELIPSYISSTQENILFTELESVLKRKKYEKGHWDQVIKNYRELQKSQWTEEIHSSILQPTIEYLKNHHQLKHDELFLPIHVLDLNAEGEIRAHVDHIHASGHLIAGLSLLSDCIMRLQHIKDSSMALEILIPRYSLYVQKNIVRYEYTHAILPSTDEYQRSRRIALLFRNAPHKP